MLIVVFGAVVRSCSSLVDFCYIKPNPAPTDLSQDPLLSPLSSSFRATAPTFSSSPLLLFVFVIICLLPTLLSLLICGGNVSFTNSSFLFFFFPSHCISPTPLMLNITCLLITCALNPLQHTIVHTHTDTHSSSFIFQLEK